MIEHPNRNLAPVIEDDGDIDARPPRAYLKAVKGARLDDPDKAFDRIIRAVDTHVVNVDAKIVEGFRQGVPQVRHYRSLREMLASPTARKRVRDAYTDSQLKEVGERMVEITGDLKEASAFDLGLYEDETAAAGGRVFRAQDTLLPYTSSPYAKQQLWVDFLDAHRKCWEASVRNPIAKRIVKIIPQFVLGRGVQGAVASKEHQKAWDQFWYENHMKGRIKQVLKELLIYGEIFLRYFNTSKGLALRSLDPSTIWDIITNPDDLEEVQYYHQQYVILNQSPAIGFGAHVLPSTLIIRQIPAAEIDHYKINTTSSEKRGRSELFAILGWLLRFKEFANDRVLLNKMRSMFALDVSVEGDQTDLNNAEAQFATPPGPGAVLIHNAAVKTEFKNANNNANEAKTDGELLLKIIAVGAGVSEQFLGVSGGNSRAGALIQTEPDVKNFEDYREMVEDMLFRASVRVFKVAGLKDPPLDMEFTFPSIAQEDRSAKLKDIAFSESMDWITKARAATMAAREFEITTYDFKTEQQHIKVERGDMPVIATGLQQMPKIAPDPGAELPGLGHDLAPANALTPNKPGVTQTSGQMGFTAKQGKAGRGLADTQATLDRPNFTRGGEKASIKGRKSTGTPLRHAAVPEGRGWSGRARELSLKARRMNKLRRMQEAAATAQAEGQTARLTALEAKISDLLTLVEHPPKT